MKESKRKIRREIAKRLKALLSRMELLPRKLRPYQVEALQAVIRWLEDPNGTARAYIEHATGLGKTELFAAIVSACVRLRALIVVPTKTLIEQTARRVVAYTGGMLGHLSSLGPIKDEGGVIIAVRGHEFCDILVTTDESLKLHGRFLAEKFAPHIVIRDECHGSYSEPEQAILDYFSDAVILGFTATPDYLGSIVKDWYVPVTLDNGRILYAPPDRIAHAHYGTCLDQRTVRWGIEEGYLAPLAWGHIEFDVSLDDVSVIEAGDVGSDYSDAQLQALLRKHWQFMVDTVVQLYKRGEYDLPNRQVFAVCVSVREAQQIANALKDAGYPAACITGKTSDKERRSILEKFKTGEIKFLSSVMVLREGWDAPNAEVCLMLRPTKSRVLYMQSMGRVLRTMPDGSFKCALVIDAYFLNTRFAPLSAPILFGQPGQTVEDGGILIGPKDDYVAIPTKSPYQRPGVKPKVMVVPAEYEVESWAGRDGSFVADGTTWLVGDQAAESFGLPKATIQKQAEEGKIRTRQARGYNSKLCTYYATADIPIGCAEYLKALLLNNKGEGMVDGERWCRTTALCRRFKLAEPTVHRYRNESNTEIRSRLGRQGNEFVMVYSFADFNKVVPKNVRSSRQPDGEWRNIWDLPAILELSYESISKRIKKNRSKVRTKPGRSEAGKPMRLYSVEDVRMICADLLSRPKVDETGLLEHEGHRWALQKALAKAFGILAGKVLFHIERNKDRIRKLEARDKHGTPVDLWHYDDAAAVFRELKENQVNKHGVLHTDTEDWVAMKAIRRLTKLKHGAIMALLNSHAVRTRKGYGLNGKECTLYALVDVQTALAK